jgi:hypothetical protein
LKQGPKGSATQQKTVKGDGADKPGEGKGSLKEAAMKNVTMLGDPVSLKVIHVPLLTLPIIWGGDGGLGLAEREGCLDKIQGIDTKCLFDRLRQANISQNQRRREQSQITRRI